jgi:3-hydroxymyristoyl/3-hydroxydecanoyl-(acyl carrier protein) dehydratase
VKWRRPVKPGDQLRCEVVILQVRGRLCKMRGQAFVGDDLVCEADMGAMVIDR